MDGDGEFFKKRCSELDSRAFSNGVYCFTEFLEMAEQSLLPARPQSVMTLYGGYSGAERLVARFAPPGACWEEPWPVSYVQASPLSGKFGGHLAHRDFLGALMGLGIKRGVIGDILVSDGSGYIVCLENIAPFIAENLREAGREKLRCSVIGELPDLALPVPEPVHIVATSCRLDALVAAVYSLSRSEAKSLFGEEKVFRNGRTAEASRDAAEGDVISVRGFGRFIYRRTGHGTRKGRMWADVDVYR